MKIVSVGSCLLCVVVAAGSIATMVVRGGDPVDPGIGDVYPLPFCPINPDVELDSDAKIVVIDGREIRVCCGDCADRVRGDSYAATSHVDELIVKHQLPLYPLTTCVVDDKPLGPAAVNFAFRNRLFRLCGSSCQAKIEQKPAVYFGKLDFAVIEKQRPTYPLDKCVVSGKPLASDSLDYVVANQLVRLSGFDQLERFGRTPGEYLLKVQEATRAKSGGAKP